MDHLNILNFQIHLFLIGMLNFEKKILLNCLLKIILLQKIIKFEAFYMCFIAFMLAKYHCWILHKVIYAKYFLCSDLTRLTCSSLMVKRTSFGK